MDGIKRIDIKEFREKGYLQEVNRRFFHPLGLALEIIIDEESGEESLGGIWDYRDDPEGMLFCDELISTKKAKERKETIDKEMGEKIDYRLKKYGWGIQPSEY